MSFHKIIFLAAIFFVLVPYVGDNDFWLHLRTGEIIVEEGHFPRTDVLSFTGQGKEWIDHEWFPQIIFYSLFKYGGFAAISLFSALMGTAIFALLLRNKKLSWLLIPLLFFVAYALRPFIVPRPQIFAYALLLGMVMTIGWYYRTRPVRSSLDEVPKGTRASGASETSNGTKSKKIIFVLPAILFLWGNMHASVILALPVFASVLAFEFGPLAKFNRSQLSRQEKEWLISAMFLALIFSLLNPFGYKIYWQALQPLRFTEAYNLLLETQPIYKFPSPMYLFMTHMTIIFVGARHFFRKRFSVIRPYELIIFLFFIAMPFVAVKYTPFAWAAILPVFLKILPGFNKKLFANIAVAGVAIASVLIFWNESSLLRDPHDEWPKEMAAFIKDNELKGNAYNPYSWGGYFAWENKTPVFINGALADLGGEAFWDAIDFDEGEKTEEVVDKYDLSIVVSQPWIILPYSLSLNNDWSLIYWDNYGVVFAKKGSGNDGIIEKYGLTIKYFNDSIEGVLKKYPAREIPELIENYKEAIRRQPELLLARYRLGLIYQRFGDCEAAIVQYKNLLSIDHKLGSAHFRLAECYEKTGALHLTAQEEALGNKYVKKEKWWMGR